MPATLITIHPLDDPDHLLNAAEQKVAEALMKLGDGFVIRWGFYYANENGSVQGEGDFLVLGPDGNVLHIEVKGGRCEFDPRTGRWDTADGKNPIIQREKVWEQLLGMLKRRAGSGRSEPLVNRMVGLPDVPIPRSVSNYQNMPRTGILDETDLAGIKDWWKGNFIQRWRDVEERRAVFLEVFAPNLQPGVSKVVISLTERQLERHTTVRFELLDALGQNEQFLFRGGPGTGKTWFALEQAFRWAREGKRVLFLTYNLELARMLGEVVTSKNVPSVKVLSYEALAKALYGMVGEQFPEVPHDDREAATRFFDSEVPKQLREMIRLLEDEHRFDALVVDEAQDHDTRFHPDVGAPDEAPGWWELYIGMLRKGAESPVAIFYDKYQRHHARTLDRFEPERLLALFPRLVRVRLKRTLRYTRQIRDFLLETGHDEIRDLLLDMGKDNILPEGPKPQVLPVKDAKAEKLAVEDLIKVWCKKGDCRPEDVLILYPTSSVRPDWLKKEKLNAVQIAPNGRSGGIRVSSVHKAKGLEAQAVILIGFPARSEVLLPTAPKGVAFTWFMGVSRARQLLAVIERQDLKVQDLRTM